MVTLSTNKLFVKKGTNVLKIYLYVLYEDLIFIPALTKAMRLSSWIIVSMALKHNNSA